MKDASNDKPPDHVGLHGHKPALQVICLASGGGPSEDNVTGFLVRSTGSEWARGSLLAVDAGTHLASITRMLELHFPAVSSDPARSEHNGGHQHQGDESPSRGPMSRSPSPTSPVLVPAKPEPTVLDSGAFAGLKFPNASARANALHVLRTYVSTYLITHPHLDHISGFAINTAAFHATSRPKTLAALPSTVDAIKEHIFNDVIWPNLSDEDGGVGFVTFQRLKEGGDLMVGEGEGRGYIDVCDGLGTKAFKVSHGTCTKGPPSHRHRGSITGLSDIQPVYSGSIQGTSQDHSSVNVARSLSISHQALPGTPRTSFHTPSHPSPQVTASEPNCVVDSTAYFLRDEFTAREVLIFGDVEPDTISMSPRNHIVWQEAGRKIAHGVLGGIFIECSYDDSQPDALLFGHLCPRHLIAELSNLAQFTVEARAALETDKSTKKRKRSGPNGLDNFARSVRADHALKRSRSLTHRPVSLDEPRRRSAADHSMPDLFPPSATPPPPSQPLSSDAPPPPAPVDLAGSPGSAAFPASGAAHAPAADTLPLSGITVVIIHIKDTLKDGPLVGENILAELRAYEARLREEGQGLGCEFVVSRSGESYWF